MLVAVYVLVTQVALVACFYLGRICPITLRGAIAEVDGECLLAPVREVALQVYQNAKLFRSRPIDIPYLDERSNADCVVDFLTNIRR